MVRSIRFNLKLKFFKIIYRITMVIVSVVLPLNYGSRVKYIHTPCSILLLLNSHNKYDKSNCYKYKQMHPLVDNKVGT